MRQLILYTVTALFAGILGIIFPEFPRADSPAKLPQIPPIIETSGVQKRQMELCPACGGLPECTTLKDTGSAWLICHDCGHEWVFQRIKCAYCGNTDPDTLLHLYVENEEISAVRFFVCNNCRRYVKDVDDRATQPWILTILQKSMINQLEWEVQNMGYTPGWVR